MIKPSLRAGALFLGLLLAACADRHDAAPPPAPAGASLEAITLKPARAPDELRFDGIVEAERQATIAAQTAGRVVALPFDVGARVRRGDVLVRLTAAEQQAQAGSAAAALAEAEARRSEASQQYERIRDLFERKLVAKAQYDSARADAEAARARAEAARGQLAQAREQSAYTSVRAPYDGIVVSRDVELGEAVGIGRPLITVLAPDALRVAADIPQQAIAALRQAGGVRVILADGTVLPAGELRIPPGASEQTRSYRVLAALPTSATTTLAPGTLVKLAFAGDAREQIAMPQSALVRRAELDAVYVIDIQQRLALRYVRVGAAAARREIEALTQGYADKPEYFVERLAGGLARLAAVYHPQPVIVRLSDFKSNEYANLIGGESFEPHEENPMIGFRGASRYYSPRYREAFALECRALKRLRETIGLRNVMVMVPFCRTPEEADRVLAEMAKCGLQRGADGLKVYVMCEIPANVILAEAFARRFDGFSIGSNDLTQLTLGIDRDSTELAPLFDESNPAVLELIRSVIARAHAAGVTVGFCGEAPSTHPTFAQFLVQAGIDSISVNPSSFLAVKCNVAATEVQTRREPGAQAAVRLATATGGAG